MQAFITRVQRLERKAAGGDTLESLNLKSVLDFSYRIRGFDYTKSFTYMKKILLEKSPRVVICKGAQLGFSEGMINLSVWNLLKKRPVLYILPSADEVSDFSQGRINQLVDASPVMKNNFCVDNVGHKLLGGTSLYLRGAHSRTKLKSIPVGFLVCDEFDEIEEEMIHLARERLSGHEHHQEFDLSTPSLPDVGIFKEFSKCDQHYYYIPCPACSKRQKLEIDDNVKGDRLYCKYCSHRITHMEKNTAITKGSWELVSKGNGIPGYHLSQLYSSKVRIQEIVQLMLEMEGNETLKQEIFNSKFGLPYEAKGSRLEGSLIDSRIGILGGNRHLFMGIDVSLESLHYCVVVSRTECGLVVEDTLRLTWEDIPKELRKRSIACCVIDARPETTKAKELRAEYHKVFLAQYLPQKELFTIDKEYVKIERTEEIDNIIGMFNTNRILIQNTLRDYATFKSHCTNEVRAYRKNRAGILESYYSEVGPDHYLHALLYADIASRIGGSLEMEGIVGSFLA